MKKYIILYIAIFALTAGCKKDFLKENPYSAYTPSNLKDALGFETALVGLYNHVSTIYTWSDQQGWVSVWQVGTDVANATANQQGVEIPYYDYTQLTPSDGGSAYIWNRYYILINLTNNIIAGASDPSITAISQADKDKIIAEAKFFRAYAYNGLATLFGGVPILTEPLTGPKTDFVRATLADVNKLVEEDLLFATTNLPDVTAAKAARGNKYMAMQLLAEAYLRMGKPDLAEAQAAKIISDAKFKLITQRYGVKANEPGDYYSDMFVYGNQRRSQGNTEVIWGLQQENTATVTGGRTGDAQQRRVFVPAYYDVSGGGTLPADSLGGRGLGRLRLSNWVLYGLYNNKDVRNSRYNIRRTFYYNNPDPAYASRYGKKIPFTGVDTLFRIAPHTTKWGSYDPKDVFGYATIKDFTLMRLGETYLLLAEARVQQQNLQGTADAINVLRQRAFANYPAEGKVNAAEMTLNFILDERARELIGEENRRMTLMRTKTLVERTLRLNSDDKAKPVKGLTSKALLLPIPLNEIQLNKDAKLEQNPDYN
ncbi:MAG: RagB/SusD family nutrient uptake outer membrane protein [Pelobium sp.]